MTTNRYRILMAVLLISNTAIAIWSGSSFSWLVSGWMAGLWFATESRERNDRKLERQIEQDIHDMINRYNQPTLNFEENNNV